MIEKMRIARVINAVDMKRKQIGAFGSRTLDLPLVQIRNQRQMIVFGEVYKLELTAFGLQKFSSRLEQSGITLEFPLVIAGTQTHIIDKKFLIVVQSIKLFSRSTVSNQDAFTGNAMAPMSDHLCNGGSGLMGQNQI